MTLQYRIVFSILLLFAGQRSSLAESKPLELKWTELAPIIHGHRVELVLKQGLKIKGEAEVVREDSLVMDVKKKRSGMFWTVRGANAITALRCCRLNGRFEDYWEEARAV